MKVPRSGVFGFRDNRTSKASSPPGRAPRSSSRILFPLLTSIDTTRKDLAKFTAYPSLVRMATRGRRPGNGEPESGGGRSGTTGDSRAAARIPRRRYHQSRAPRAIGDPWPVGRCCRSTNARKPESLHGEPGFSRPGGVGSSGLGVFSFAQAAASRASRACGGAPAARRQRSRCRTSRPRPARARGRSGA